jgi:hypothetical protein
LAVDDSPIGEPKTRLDRKRIVIDGPLAETKELICGFWLWQVKSKEKAIRMVKRCPNPHNEYRDRNPPGVRPRRFWRRVHSELREQQERLRAQIVEKK